MKQVMHSRTVILTIAATAVIVLTSPAEAGLNRWTSHSPFGTTVTSIAADATGQTLYVGTSGSGLYKSTDAGEHWEIVGDAQAANVTALAVDPLDPQAVVAGTADSFVYTTTDGGASWIAHQTIAIPLSLQTADHGRLIYLDVRYAALRSTDGGGHWDENPNVLQKNILSLVQINGRTFAGTDLGVYYTDDWVTWTGPAAFPIARVPAIAGVPGTSTVLAAANDNVLRSDDFGLTWQMLPSTGLSGAAINALAAPDRQSVYAATDDGVLRFDGNQWVTFGDALRGSRVDTVIGAANQSLIAATSRGVFKTPASVATWRPAQHGFGRAAANDASVVPSDPDVVIAATEAGIVKSVDQAETWHTTLGDAANHVRVSAGAPATMYATTTTTIEKSTDSGEHWQGIKTTRMTSGFDISADGRTVYAALSDHLVRSDDGGATWSAADDGLNMYYAFYNDFTAPAIAVDPTNSMTALESEWDGIYRTDKGGKPWALVAQLASLPLAIDPNQPSRVYGAGYGGRGLRTSTDAGKNWVLDTFPLDERIRALAVSRSDSSVYVGTMSGHVYVRRAGETVWTRIDAGLSGSVNGIAVSASGTVLYAATTRGVFVYDAFSSDFVAVTGGATSVAQFLDRAQPIDGSMFVIPIAGQSRGAYGTSFSSDLTISNSRDNEQDVVVAWLPGDGSSVVAFRTKVPPHSSGSIVADAIAERLGETGVGAVLVQAVTSSGDVDTNAVINGSGYIWTTSESIDETGQTIASIHPTALQPRSSATVAGLRQDADVRTNVGIVNLQTRAETFVVNLRGERHSEQFSVTVAPLSLAHISIPNADYGALTATVSTADASRWAFYGSTIENATGIGETIIANE